MENNVIVYKLLSELKAYENNPRENEKSIGAIAASIQAFGFLVPVVIDADNVIVCGHARCKAAEKLGMVEVPCILADDLTPEQVRAFRLVDNKTAELAVWDEPLLDEELEDIGDTMDMSDFGFDLGLEDLSEIDTAKEFDLDDFGDDTFEYRCPECGFRFNEYV